MLGTSDTDRAAAEPQASKLTSFGVKVQWAVEASAQHPFRFQGRHPWWPCLFHLGRRSRKTFTGDMGSFRFTGWVQLLL